MSDELDESLDSENEEQEPKPKRENSTIKQMREALESTKAEATAAQEKAARFEKAWLASSGLTEKQAKVFQTMEYDPSDEGLTTFRADMGLATETEEVPESDAETDDAEETTFEPTRGGASPAGKREWTSNEVVELTKHDPVKADKILRDGRVKRQKFNPGGPAF